MTRAATGLDPMPSAAKIREMYERRTGRALDSGSRVEMTIGKFTIERDAVVEVVQDQRSIMLGDCLQAERNGNTLRMTLGFPPRTKKNSTTLGIRQSPAYRAYRDAVKRILQPALGQLGLPLPPRPATYNIAAVYYVDQWGASADRPGLDNGLFDALQDAGVIVNDWQLRTTEGTRIVIGDPNPRVEILITPLEE